MKERRRTETWVLIIALCIGLLGLVFVNTAAAESVVNDDGTIGVVFDEDTTETVDLTAYYPTNWVDIYTENGTNVRVDIDDINGVAAFSAPQDWSGSDTVKIRAKYVRIITPEPIIEPIRPPEQIEPILGPSPEPVDDPGTGPIISDPTSPSPGGKIGFGRCASSDKPPLQRIVIIEKPILIVTYIEKTFSVTVNPVNDAPEILQEMNDVSFDENEGLDDAFDLNDYFYDRDSALTYSAQSDDGNVIVTITSGGSVDFDSTMYWNGETAVTFTASDGEYPISQSIRVTVNPVNNAPLLKRTLPSIEFTQGDSVLIGLNDYFTDPDGDSLTFLTDGSGHIYMRIDSATGVLTLSSDAWYGEEIVTIYAYDGELATHAPLSVKANQKSVIPAQNREPVLTRPLPEISLKEGESVSIDLDSYFTDPDGDRLMFAFSAVNIDADLDSETNILTLRSVGAGTGRLTIYVSDGSTRTTEEMTIVAASDTNTASAGTGSMGMAYAGAFIVVLIAALAGLYLYGRRLAEKESPADLTTYATHTGSHPVI